MNNKIEEIDISQMIAEQGHDDFLIDLHIAINEQDIANGDLRIGKFVPFCFRLDIFDPIR